MEHNPRLVEFSHSVKKLDLPAAETKGKKLQKILAHKQKHTQSNQYLPPIPMLPGQFAMMKPPTTTK